MLKTPGFSPQGGGGRCFRKIGRKRDGTKNKTLGSRVYRRTNCRTASFTRMLAKTADWRPNRRLEFLLQPLAITWRTMVALEYVVLSVPKSLRSVTSLSSVCNTAAQQPHGTGPRNKAEKPQTDGTTSFNGREDEEATRGNHCF